MDKHTHRKAALHRIARATGHMNFIRSMIEGGRDCSEILIQLSAVRAEITNLSKLILKDHIDHCIIDAVTEGDDQSIENLKNAVDKLL